MRKIKSSVRSLPFSKSTKLAVVNNVFGHSSPFPKDLYSAPFIAIWEMEPLSPNVKRSPDPCLSSVYHLLPEEVLWVRKGSANTVCISKFKFQVVRNSSILRLSPDLKQLFSLVKSCILFHCYCYLLSCDFENTDSTFILIFFFSCTRD